MIITLLQKQLNAFKKLCNCESSILSNMGMLIPLVCLFFSCNPNKDQIEFYLNDCNSIDSIQKFYQANYLKVKPVFASKVAHRIKKTNPEGFSVFVNRINKFHQGLPGHEDRKLYSKIDLCYDDVRKSNIDKVKIDLYQIENTPYLKNNADTAAYLNFHNLKGIYYYFTQDYDSALYHYGLGMKWAINNQSVREVEQFANNIGAINYYQRKNETAIENFLLAYKYLQLRNGNNPVLVSNIASILMSQYKFKQAQNFLLQSKNELLPSNLEYAGILIKLNYIRLMQLQNNQEEAHRVFKTLENAAIPENLKSEFLNEKLLLRFYLDPSNIERVIKENYSEVNKYRLDFLGKFPLGPNSLVKKVPNLAQLMGYTESDLDSLPNDFPSLNSKSVLLEILANQAFAEGDFLNSKKYLSKSLDLNRQESSYIDSVRVLDVESKIKHQKFQKEYQDIQLEQKRNKRIILLQNVAIVVSVIVVLLGSLLYIYRNKFIEQRQNYLRNQLNSANQIAEKLKTENELNAQITALSTVLMEQSSQIYRKLSESQFSKDPIILQVKSDLERISKTHILESSVLRKMEMSQRYRTIWENPEFSELTKTQRDILILSIEGVKSKEIAQIMNVSYSHVRNTRSYLKKMLMDLGISDFEELRKMETT